MFLRRKVPPSRGELLGVRHGAVGASARVQWYIRKPVCKVSI